MYVLSCGLSSDGTGEELGTSESINGPPGVLISQSKGFFSPLCLFSLSLSAFLKEARK